MNLLEKLKNRINNRNDISGNKQIVQLTYFFSLLFVVLIAYIAIIVYRDSDAIINNSYNKRESIYANKTVRGSILSEDGEILAYTELSTNEEKRIYPYGKIFAHVVGYNSKGKAGIENSANFLLLKSNILFTDRIKNELSGKKNPGDSVVTTLDLNSQFAAYQALNERNGAVILMDADNGYILAMVSKPDFDPNDIDLNWDYLVNEKGNASLLNKVTQGLYPPGSTFKILTALEYLKENTDVSDYEFDCPGYFEYKGNRINCYHGVAHGTVNFDQSFAKSCNASFANITTKLKKKGFRDTCESLLFNEKMPSPLIINNRSSFWVKDSFVPINSKSPIDELMQTGIGQGKTEISPYHMCLISSAIANDGILMNPIIVKEIETAAGDHVTSCSVRPYKRLLSSEDSAKVRELMRGVITEGTGSVLYNTSGYEAYGKTGSAEFSSNKTESHAWFTGFAVGDNGRTVAISVIVENGGSGGQVAAPVARAVFDAYFNK